MLVQNVESLCDSGDLLLLCDISSVHQERNCLSLKGGVARTECVPNVTKSVRLLQLCCAVINPLFTRLQQRNSIFHSF